MSQIVSPLKELRESKGLTRDEFALVLGCSGATMHNLENGVTKIGPAVANRLTELIESADEIIRRHKDWVKQRAEELEQRFRAKK